MIDQDKILLVVDDSDVDRMILRTILGDEFKIIEKSSGFSAINSLNGLKDSLDALLLDVSMPAVDGFDVLQFMKDSGIDNIPVFLITAEATKENVEKATQYGVVEFIRKPFDKDYILRRIKIQLGIISEYALTKEDIKETHRYIAELETIYKRYLANYGQDQGHCARVRDLMRILLTRYAASYEEQNLDKKHIEIISKAGYFYDIGNMAVPPETVKAPQKSGVYRDHYRQHTILGAEIINLNQSGHCRYFMDVCSDICMHHHERYDGKGYPHRILGKHNLICSQICRLAIQFDRLFMQYREQGRESFGAVLEELQQDKGNVSQEVLAALSESGEDIAEYYLKVQ